MKIRENNSDEITMTLSPSEFSDLVYPLDTKSHISKSILDEYYKTTKKENKIEGENKMNMTNMFNGMFGKVAPGMCRVSMNGDIAIKTNSGYKTYNVTSGMLTNCDNFAFDVGEDWFFVVPTNKVEKGDIILAGGKPRCVIGTEDNAIKTFCYEDGTIGTIVPEHHVFMGKQYFYGKIVSLFGNMMNDENGMGNIMKFMMMNEMMKGNNGGNNGMNNMLPMMMMMNGGFNFMDKLFDTKEPAKTTEKEEA